MADNTTQQNAAINAGPFKKDISYVEIECDENYYSTPYQVIHKRSPYVDKSVARLVSGSSIATGFFGITDPKKKPNDLIVSRQYLSSSAKFDDYRNGIEITNQNQWMAGTVKISAGTPGHLVDPVCKGAPQVSIISQDWYKEIDLFNPIYFIELQEDDKPIENIITFPIVTNDSNQLENYVLDGIIEPFPIRPIISNFTINVPFEPQGVRGVFGNGNTTWTLSSDIVNSIDYFIPQFQNNNLYLDMTDDLTMTNDEGTSTRHFGASIYFFNDGVNYLFPFDDKVTPRGDDSTISSYDDDLKKVVQSMKPMGASYIDKDKMSARTGFIYDGSGFSGGVDSVTFGGLRY